MTSSIYDPDPGITPAPRVREIVTRAAVRIVGEAASAAITAIVNAERAAPRAIVVPRTDVRIVTTTPAEVRDAVDELVTAGYTASQIEWEA